MESTLPQQLSRYDAIEKQLSTETIARDGFGENFQRRVVQ